MGNALQHELLNVFEEDSLHIRYELEPFLERLDVQERKLLEMYFRDGLTSTEIGRRLAMNPAAVRQAKARLLAKLHNQLTK